MRCLFLRIFKRLLSNDDLNVVYPASFQKSIVTSAGHIQLHIYNAIKSQKCCYTHDLFGS